MSAREKFEDAVFLVAVGSMTLLALFICIAGAVQ